MQFLVLNGNENVLFMLSKYMSLRVRYWEDWSYRRKVTQFMDFILQNISVLLFDKLMKSIDLEWISYVYCFY